MILPKDDVDQRVGVSKGEFAVLEAVLETCGVHWHGNEINPNLVRQITGHGKKTLYGFLFAVAEHVANLHHLAHSISFASRNE